MLHFDRTTIADWQSRNITDVSVFFYESGCAGTKVKVEEGISPDMDSKVENNDPQIHVRSSEKRYLESGHITHMKRKWIYKSDEVNTRCGCGSSFSLKSDSPLQDKVARMKLAIKQKKEGIHN